MQACFNLSNIIARDTCAESLIGTASPGNAAGLAIVACIVACAIVATLATKYL